MSQVIIKQFEEMEETREREQMKVLMQKFQEFLDAEKQEGDESEQLLQDKKKKRKFKKGCSRGNWRHEPAGQRTGGRFAKTDGFKKGSSSIAGKPEHKNKKNCRKGVARVSGGSERFIPHAQNCGRKNPKNKCSEAKPRVAENVKVPQTDNGMISVEQFAIQLDRKQRQIEKLQGAIKTLRKQKCKNISVGDLIKTTNDLALSLKGKLEGDAPAKGK